MHRWLTTSVGPEVSHLCRSLTSQKSSPFPPICTLPSHWGEKTKMWFKKKKIINCPLLLSQLQGAAKQFILYSMRWSGMTEVHLSPQSSALALYFSWLEKTWHLHAPACSWLGCCKQHTSILAAKEAVHFYLRLSIQKRKNSNSGAFVFPWSKSPRSAPGRFWPQHAGLAVKLNCLIFTVIILRDTTNFLVTLR